MANKSVLITNILYFEKRSFSNFKSFQVRSLVIPIKSGIRGNYSEFLSIDLILLILRVKPDIIILDSNTLFSFFYLFLGKFIGSKIISFTSSFPDVSSLWGRISNFILKNNTKFVNQCVVPNSIKKQLMINMGINSNKINIIGHGVDTKLFSVLPKK